MLRAISLFLWFLVILVALFGIPKKERKLNYWSAFEATENDYGLYQQPPIRDSAGIRLYFHMQRDTLPYYIVLYPRLPKKVDSLKYIFKAQQGPFFHMLRDRAYSHEEAWRLATKIY